MNNTSAYANVLLKSPVAAPAAASKRDYQSDDSAADFHQTLKSAHESQQGQNEKAYKSTSHKKTAQVEHRKDAGDTTKVKDVNTTNEPTIQKKLTDEPEAQSKKTLGDKTTERGMPVKKAAKECVEGKQVDEIHTEDELNELVANCDATVAPLIQDTVPIGMNIVTPVVSDVSTLPDDALAIKDVFASTQIDSAEQPASPITTSLDSDSAVSTIPAALGENNVILTDESIVTDVVTPAPNTVTTVKDMAATANPSLITGAISTEQNISQQLDDSSGVSSVNQSPNPAAPVDAQAVAASVVMTSAVATKPLQSQTAVSDVEDIAEIIAPATSEANALSKPTAVMNTSTDSNASAGSNSALLNSDTTTQAHMQASKSAFEKTLQAVVTPESVAADDAVPISSASSSASPANQLMDSLVRTTDLQTPAARGFVVQTAVPVPVGQPQWSQAVGEKVLWLAAQNVSSAEINLNPKDLGPIQVKVSVNQEQQTTVSFTSHHAVVRDVLDQNLNRLRDMFSEQGLNLVNVDVSDKSFSRQQGDAKDQKGQGGAQDIAQDEETPIAMSTIVQQRLVDHYA